MSCVATLPCYLLLIMMHASDFHYFSDISVSQGRVATCLTCDGIVNDDLPEKFTCEFASERMLKIGQHLAKLCARL